MIENNGNKPTKESELDITELLRRYMDEDTADESIAETTNVEKNTHTEKNDEVAQDSVDTYVKPRRKRRMTAVKIRYNAKSDADESDVSEPAKDVESVEQLELLKSIESTVVEERDDSEQLSLEEMLNLVPEELDVASEIEGIDASGKADDETVDEDILIFAPASDTSEKTSESDFVEPGARSFDPDVDILSDFEEPTDDLYGFDAEPEKADEASESVLEEMGSNESEDDNVGTIVFDAISESSKASDEDFEVEQAEEKAEVDDFDLNIMLALGMESELHESMGEQNVTAYVEKQQGDIEKAKAVNRERSRLKFEYTNKSQTSEIREKYAFEKKKALIKLIYAFLLTFALLLFECHDAFGITLDGAFSPTVYPVVFIMVGLQLSLLIAAPAYDSIYNGIRNFFGGQPAPDSIATFALILNVIYSAVISFADLYEEGGPVTFNLPVSVIFVMLYIGKYINVKREILSFDVVSSKKPKYALENLTMSESHLEHEAFSDMMEDDDDANDIGVLKVECADFVNDYCLRTERYPNGRKFIGFIIPASIVVAAAFFAFSYNGDNALYSGMKSAVSTALVCLPASVFYMFSHPFYLANKKAYEDDATIVGESSAEEYADAAIISFDDKNVFPSTGVNVRAINVFGNNRIDVVLYYAASVFCNVGGPLSDVFDIATRDIGYSSDMRLISTLPGLLQAEVDGSMLSFGTIDALEASGVRIPAPLEAHRNDAFESTVSVMYIVKDGKFISRMLISYVVDSEFELILKQLDRGGMFVGLKTFDPNITEQFLGAQIKLEDYPIRIIRCKDLGDKTKVSETTESGLVSKDSPKSVIQTVALCEKMLHARSVNTMLVVISLFVSLGVVALSLLFDAFALSPIFISLYSLVWIVPMLIVSKMII